MHMMSGPTFAFNSFAICADMFGLFATLCWVFSDDMYLLQNTAWPHLAGQCPPLSASLYERLWKVSEGLVFVAGPAPTAPP